MSSSTEECLVEYNHLGKSGLKVSNICLGTMTFGRIDDKAMGLCSLPSQLDEDNAHQMLDRYTQLGGNFVDTANVYSLGQSEQLIGSWLKKQNRDKVVIATKVRAPMGKDPNNVDLSRRHIIKSCEDSLSRLQTDYIDLYQTHTWDNATPVEETLMTLHDLVRCGKIRYIGVSNLVGWQMQKVVDVTKYMNLSPVISLQQQYNLLTRHSEFEEFQVCKNEGLGALTFTPLKGGALTGKYKQGEAIDSVTGRIASVSMGKIAATQASPDWKTYVDNERYWNLRSIMEQIANNHGKSVAQVAIRWSLQKDVVSSVIIGATTVKQLEENMAAGTGWSLSKEEMAQLDEASKPDIPYPYEIVWRSNATRMNRYMPNYAVSNLI